MIKFKNNNEDRPYVKLRHFYNEAQLKGQKKPEAIVVSSYNFISNEVDSRYVNLKIIDNEKFIFFTNYESPKAQQFASLNKIAVSIYWNSINTQIRIKALITKTDVSFNKSYFKRRSIKKNALSISSMQSRNISSYREVLEKYNYSLDNSNLTDCPKYWGGFSFTPYYFEFWRGHKHRINEREAFNFENGVWNNSFLEP